MRDPVRRIGRTINVRIRIKPGVDLAAPEWTARGGRTSAEGREVGPVARGPEGVENVTNSGRPLTMSRYAPQRERENLFHARSPCIASRFCVPLLFLFPFRAPSRGAKTRGR